MEIPGYQIRHLLSWGAQGDVFLGVDGASRPVALKVVVRDRAGADPRGAERLRREARLLGAIRSPHVVAVHALVETEELSCLVLDYLEGERLDAALRARAGDPVEGGHDERVSEAETVQLGPDRTVPKPRPAPKREVPAAFRSPEHVGWALDIAVQLARALAELHAINLVHRDVKPENVMLVDGRVVLIDFGLARTAGVTTLTQSHALVGSLAYMSPEQFVGGEGTKRSDVYACGASIHACLLGAPPHVADGGSLAELGTPKRSRSVRRRNPAVPRDLAAVVARALEPDARDRHPDARALLDDLERCQRGEPVQIPFSLGRAWRHHRRRVAWGAGAIAAVLLVWWATLLGSADADAVRLARLLQHEPAAAAAAWQELDEPRRLAVIDEMNQRLGDNPTLAHVAARTLQLGLLRTGGRSSHLGALVASREDAAPVAPALRDFLPLDRPRCFLAPVGRAWFLVLSRDRGAWWSPADPRCLQLLVELTVPPGEVVERPLRHLATEFRIVGLTPWSSLGPPAESDDDAVMVGQRELGQEDVRMVRVSLSSYVAERAELDVWLRHPNEPPGVADTIWAAWAEPGKRTDAQPALVTFWEAHRLAAWAGCRLPTIAEWQVASESAGALFGKDADRVVPEHFQDVHAVPAWDRTAAGVCFANSNVREWAANLRPGQPRSNIALPGLLRAEGGVREFSALRMTPFNAIAEDRYGMRLYRSFVRP